MYMKGFPHSKKYYTNVVLSFVLLTVPPHVESSLWSLLTVSYEITDFSCFLTWIMYDCGYCLCLILLSYMRLVKIIWEKKTTGLSHLCYSKVWCQAFPSPSLFSLEIVVPFGPSLHPIENWLTIGEAAKDEMQWLALIILSFDIRFWSVQIMSHTLFR